MPTVEVRFTPLPAHVRTARLVALAVARRAGVSEDLLDEVRLAVGEACSRAVGVHETKASEKPVTMLLIDDTDRFSVEVTDVGLIDPASQDGVDGVDASPSSNEGSFEDDALPPEFGLAVISGLVDDVTVDTEGGVTAVRMSWPATHPLAGRDS